MLFITQKQKYLKLKRPLYCGIICFIYKIFCVDLIAQPPPLLQKPSLELIASGVRATATPSTVKLQPTAVDASALTKTLFVDAQAPAALEISNPFYNQALPRSYALASVKKELQLGTTLPTDGAVSLIGQDISYGMDLVFNQINQAGGLLGNLIKIKTLDSANEVMLAEKNIRDLTQATPFFLSVFGSETVASVLDLIKTEKIFMLFPSAGDTMFRKSELRNILHFRASIADEISALLTYAVTKLYRNKIGIFYEDSRWGEEGLQQAEAALKKLGFKILVSASYPENTVEITSAINKIADKSPNAVLCISHARPTYNFVIQALKKGLKSCKFLGLGEVVPIQEILQKSRGINLITSSVVPNPVKSEIPLVVRYRKEMAQFFANKNMSQFFLEGYCAASILVECLKQIPPPFTLENLVARLEGLKNFDFEGLSLNFDPATRGLSTDVWINIGKDKLWPMFKKSTL